ncbi:MAG: nucleotidyl transferase AbiEii/AbiGii toxin family protein [Anaerolineales bacterium]|nr:nucleotidyl transferase AbiEii/AbiGii toxin family protein [Anaerolineales bacterium]
MDNAEIHSILHTLGEHISTSTRLYLIGGSALALLGSQRLTIDIDFIGDDISPSEAHKSILQTAKELKIFLEPVALEKFIPLPHGSDKRNIRIGQFGKLEIFVADPHSIALSKLDRGFDTDLDDIVFLIQHKYIEIGQLKQITEIALSRAREFDINSDEMLAHLKVVEERLG